MYITVDECKYLIDELRYEIMNRIDSILVHISSIQKKMMFDYTMHTNVVNKRIDSILHVHECDELSTFIHELSDTTRCNVDRHVFDTRIVTDIQKDIEEVTDMNKNIDLNMGKIEMEDEEVTFNVDEEGYLIDKEGNYVLDDEGISIKLSIQEVTNYIDK